MKVTAIKTRPLTPPKDDLLGVIKESIDTIPEKSVLAVSSKVAAIAQGRCIKIPDDPEEARALKEKLIVEESDLYLPRNDEYRYSRIFTVYEGMFGSSSGLDESNGDGYFVLLPKDAKKCAEDILSYLQETYNVSDCGVVLVDSVTKVMRNGVIGIALAHAGFQAVFDYRGKEDIFGRSLMFERLHVADCLATTATLLMGEGDECTPLALFEDIPRINFAIDNADDDFLTTSVVMEHDVFAQFLCNHEWKKGGRSKE